VPDDFFGTQDAKDRVEACFIKHVSDDELPAVPEVIPPVAEEIPAEGPTPEEENAAIENEVTPAPEADDVPAFVPKPKPSNKKK